MNNKTILQADKISKSFPGVKALDNICLDIRSHEVHVILGENGAGKSTLMKILSGVYTPDEGEIKMNGNVVKFTSTKQASELGITIIHQEFNLMPHLNVAENILLGREPKNKFGMIDFKQLHKQTKELLDRLKTNIDTYELISELSVASQQMVEIAKALSFNSSVLIMDEPTAALTDQEIDSLFVVVEELKSSGLGIVYISHRMEELNRIADRVTVLRDGTYITTVNFKDTTIPNLIELMVGREMTQLFPEKDIKMGKTCLTVKNFSRKGFFENINFELKSGEIMGISGLMGAGRTSLGRALSGIDRYDSGEIVVDTVKMNIKSVREALYSGIAYLSEDRKKEGLFLELSVGDNIMIPNLVIVQNAVGKINFKKSLSIISDYIEKVHIKTPSHKQEIRFLSGGNQQKAIIARLICRPKVVFIIDEPTRGIDVNAKYEIYTLLFELAKSGAGIIMISSELPEILGISDKVLVMAEGKMTALLKNDENLNSATIMGYATGQFKAMENIK